MSQKKYVFIIIVCSSLFMNNLLLVSFPATPTQLVNHTMTYTNACFRYTHALTGNTTIVDLILLLLINIPVQMQRRHTNS